MTPAAVSHVLTPARRKRLHVALWLVQGLLALAFGLAGVMKLATPIEELAKNMAWVGRFEPGMVRFIGLAELLGAIGLIVPAVTRIAPVLTSLSGLGLGVVMALAAGHHIAHSEPGTAVNVVLGALALFVAWGRWRQLAIAPRLLRRPRETVQG